jgi:endonuclease/exonuclease/phosphatase family metal-dependent hydrolase
MTWNIQSYKSVAGFRINACEYAAEIIKRDVGVVALQEVQKPVAELIVKCLKERQPGVGWDSRWIQVSNTKKIPQGGMAIMSKFPIVGSRQWDLPAIFKDKIGQDREEDKPNRRVLQRVTVVVGARKVHIYNTHLGIGQHSEKADKRSDCEQDDKQLQQCQVEKIARVVQDRSDGDFTPLILGDFNVTPWNDKGQPGAIAALTRAGFIDAWAALYPIAADYTSCSLRLLPPSPRSCGYTYETRDQDARTPTPEIPTKRIDYIFARKTPELSPVEVWSPVLDNLIVQDEFGRLSDHYPVIATLRFAELNPR